MSASVMCAPEQRSGPSANYRLSQAEYVAQASGGLSQTDDDGKAQLIVSVSTIGTKLLDEVTGEYFLFRIDHDTSEVLSVLMRVGESRQGRHFKITVDSIGGPIRDE